MEFLRYYLDKEVIARLDSQSAQLAHINSTLEDILATQQDHEDALARVEAATTAAGAAAVAIGARITALEETIKGLGLSAEQENAILARTQGIAANAEALAAALGPMAVSPTDPVPVPVPEPVPPA